MHGQDLFQYVDENGKTHAISSSEMNDYLRSLTGENFTAKDFRTGYGTINAVIELIKYEKIFSETEAKQNVVETIKKVAKKLGNTPAICRKCYVHLVVIASYLNGKLSDDMLALTAKKALDLESDEKNVKKLFNCKLSVEEEVVLKFLQTTNP